MAGSKGYGTDPVKAGKFTSGKAARLRALRAEVADLEASQAVALRALQEALSNAGLGSSGPQPPDAIGAPVPSWVAQAACCADDLRDALEPFDSGCREVAAAEPGPSFYDVK